MHVQKTKSMYSVSTNDPTLPSNEIITRSGLLLKHGLNLPAMMIIVSGLPGSGKSYFASRLSEELSATYISSDLTRKEIDAQGQYAFEDKLNVYEEMAYGAGQQLRNGKRVVIDATFYRKEMRELFYTLAKLLDIKIVFIEIVADEEIIAERLSKPRLTSEADYSVYKFVKSQYEALDREHLVIESTNDNIEGMLMKAVDYIAKVNEST
jgi:predicted kinase